MTPCEACKGACCEFYALNLSNLPEDKRKWVEMHGKPSYGPYTEFNCRCEHLTKHGKCGIYDSRPQLCRDFKVGSPMCIYSIKTRRGLPAQERIFKLIARMGKEQ